MAAYPPLWGYIIWSLLHAVGKAFAVHHPEDIPSELADALMRFLTRLCRYLPCPGCRVHCQAYINQHPPQFSRGLDVWTYLVDFHNAVNKRTNKLEVSYAEADALLTKQLQEFQCTPSKIEEAFLQDWWTALMLTTFNLSLTPDAPKDEERQEFRAFMRVAMMVVPFAFRTLESDRSVRATLVAFVDSPGFDLTNRDTTFESVTNLHNSVSAEFGRLPKTVKEMKELFGQRFEQKNTSDLIRAHQIHEEDHKKMIALQQELNDLRTLGRDSVPEADRTTDTGVSSNYQTATIALSCLLGVVLVLLLVAWLTYRFKWSGEWQWVRKRSSAMTSRRSQRYRSSSSSSSSSSEDKP